MTEVLQQIANRARIAAAGGGTLILSTREAKTLTAALESIPTHVHILTLYGHLVAVRVKPEAAQDLSVAINNKDLRVDRVELL